ncbi:MAG: helix-turn-helix domain protein [Bacteroidetes bacterium]|nr:helix-turn-helix domain protein [Bacteroidota bacterium]
MNIGYKIKKLREWKGLSQEYIADEIGINQSTYSKIEGGADLTLSRLEQISKVLEVSPEDIICFNEKQMVFNLSNNTNASGVTIKNQVSKNEKLIYEELIKTLKAENNFLKLTIDKLLRKYGKKG